MENRIEWWSNSDEWVKMMPAILEMASCHPPHSNVWHSLAPIQAIASLRTIGIVSLPTLLVCSLLDSVTVSVEWEVERLRSEFRSSFSFRHSVDTDSDLTTPFQSRFNRH